MRALNVPGAQTSIGFGDQPEQESLSLPGPILKNSKVRYGSLITTSNGSMDTKGNRTLLSTISEDPYANSPHFLDCWTDILTESQLKDPLENGFPSALSSPAVHHQKKCIPRSPRKKLINSRVGSITSESSPKKIVRKLNLDDPSILESFDEVLLADTDEEMEVNEIASLPSLKRQRDPELMMEERLRKKVKKEVEALTIMVRDLHRTFQGFQTFDWYHTNTLTNETLKFRTQYVVEYCDVLKNQIDIIKEDL